VTNSFSVLLYLESLPRHSEYQSPTSPVHSESRRKATNEWGTNEPEESPLLYDQVNEVNGNGREQEWDSNVQERMMSGLGEVIPIYSAGLVRFLCFVPMFTRIDR